MAKSNGEEKATVEAWAKAQADYEKAQRVADDAQKVAQGYVRKLYEMFGTEPFEVKALGRSYRAFYTKARQSTKGKAIQESWKCIPLPDNAPTRSF